MLIDRTNRFEHGFAHRTGEAHILIRDGYNSALTQELVSAVLNFRHDIRSQELNNYRVHEAADTGCYVLVEGSGVSRDAVRIFDLACAYAPADFVEAMMQHPGTPVAEKHGVIMGKTALVELALKIANDGRHDDQPIRYSRLNVFKTLIQDPRTDVHFRYDTYEGETHGVLDVLKRYRNNSGYAYYPAVSQLLQQRQVLIATAEKNIKDVERGFRAAGRALLADSEVRFLNDEKKNSIRRNLAEAIRWVEFDELLEAWSAHTKPLNARGHFPEFVSLDPDQFRQKIGQISPKETARAKRDCASRVWLKASGMACLKNGLFDSFLSRPSPDLHKIAHAAFAFNR